MVLRDAGMQVREDVGVEMQRGGGNSMPSTSEMISVYLELISSSVDSETMQHPDIRYITHQLSREDFEAAEDRCLLRIQNYGEDAFTWALVGLSRMLQIDVQGAEEALLRASELEPENLLVLNLMGDYLCRAGKDVEGEALYLQSLSKDEEQVHPRKMMYFQFMSRNEYLQALDMIIPVLNTCPEDKNTWTSIRTAVAMMGSHDYAEEMAESLTEEFKDLHRAWHFKAHVYLATKKYRKAQRAAKRAIKLKQDDGENWNMLGTILSMRGKYTAAVKCQRKAIKLEPKNGMFWTSLGLALLKAGKRNECKQVIGKAVKLDPAAAMGLIQHMQRG